MKNYRTLPSDYGDYEVEIVGIGNYEPGYGYIDEDDARRAFAEYMAAVQSWEAARAAGEPMTRGQLYAPLYDGDDLPTADPA